MAASEVNQHFPKWNATFPKVERDISGLAILPIYMSIVLASPAHAPER